MLDPTSQAVSSNQSGVVGSAQGWPTPDDPDFYMDLDFPTWPAAPATQGRAIVNSYLICKLKKCADCNILTSDGVVSMAVGRDYLFFKGYLPS